MVLTTWLKYSTFLFKAWRLSYLPQKCETCMLNLPSKPHIAHPSQEILYLWGYTRMGSALKCMVSSSQAFRMFFTGIKALQVRCVRYKKEKYEIQDGFNLHWKEKLEENNFFTFIGEYWGLSVIGGEVLYPLQLPGMVSLNAKHLICCF